MHKSVEETDIYIKYLEAKVIDLEGKILRMIYKDLQIEKVKDAEEGEEAGC